MTDKAFRLLSDFAAADAGAGRAFPENAPATKLNGRVLRVKSGYNPNSSSIGTLLPSFHLMAGANLVVLSGLLLLTVGTLVRSARRKNADGNASSRPAESHLGEEGSPYVDEERNALALDPAACRRTGCGAE